MHTTFKQKLLGGEHLLGTILSLPVPELAEICINSGFDWLFLDMEHGLLDIAGVQRLAQVAGNRCACLARVPVIDETCIKRALDTGINGLVIPMVNTPELAARAVHLAKYPPLGARSVGLARAHAYGADFQKYVDTANQNTVIIIQVEHIQAVNNIEKILDVEGIDGVFIGPYDLSASMGKAGQIADDSVREAIRQTKEACQARRIPVGTFARDIIAARRAKEEGYSFLAVGIDSALFSDIALQITRILKNQQD